MNHHISNCDRDYLQSTHKAPLKQWPLLMENIKPDRVTHLTHASLLQHQLPTAASPLELTQSSVPVTGWAKPLELTAASSGSLSHPPATSFGRSAKSSPAAPVTPPVQVAVTTENQVGQRDSKPCSHPTSNAAVNLIRAVFLDWPFQVWSGI